MSLGLCIEMEELLRRYDSSQLNELKKAIEEIEEERRPKVYHAKYIKWVLNGHPDGLTKKQIMLITGQTEESVSIILDYLEKIGDAYVYQLTGSDTKLYCSVDKVNRNELKEAGQ